MLELEELLADSELSKTTQQAIREALRENPCMSHDDLSERLDVAPRALSWFLV